MLKGLSARLNALPRDGRDTLFLLAVIAWVVMPQVGNLPLWCSALAAGVLLWRGWLALGARPLPGKWWLLGLLALTIGATLLTHRTLLGRDALVDVTALIGFYTIADSADGCLKVLRSYQYIAANAISGGAMRYEFTQVLDDFGDYSGFPVARDTVFSSLLDPAYRRQFAVSPRQDRQAA